MCLKTLRVFEVSVFTHLIRHETSFEIQSVSSYLHDFNRITNRRANAFSQAKFARRQLIR